MKKATILIKIIPSSLFLLLESLPAIGEIVPDNTLPVNSQIKHQNNTTFIEGGTLKNGNLFHSFDQFSLPTNKTAIFNNLLNVQNIFSRVTGKSISNIDGILQANGKANLFFINPNGIVFGQNARINIGGSFVGSTANSLKFADGFEFSAINPQASLLTISTPIGLQFKSNPGRIQVQGAGQGLIAPSSRNSPTIRNSNVTGLRVQNNKTLALVGGDIDLQGSTLTAEQGRIELGSVGFGMVSLSPVSQGWTLSYQKVPFFKNIQLSQQALVDTTGDNSGSIAIQGKTIYLRDGSAVLSQNLGSQSSGSISINATELVKLSGASTNGRFASLLRTESTNSGTGGNIDIFTKHLVIERGAIINTRTYSTADGGNITINAADSIQLLGFSTSNPFSVSSINAGTLASGKAGNITISTRQLEAQDGGEIASLTIASGFGGDVIVNTSDLKLINSKELINSGNFFLPSRIASTTFNEGNAGNLIINTHKLEVFNESSINTSSVGSGSAGNLTVNAADVNLSGGRVSSAVVNADKTTQETLGSPPVANGSSGQLVFNTENLRLNNGIISGRNLGTGEGGIILINGRFISLNQESSITTATASGQSGDIFINSQTLNLRNGSTIAATAGNNGNGGNITISTQFLSGSGNSSITANALEGRGGNIRINTLRLLFSPNSKITASSERGINGTVENNINNQDPSRFKAIPEAVAETPKIASACESNSRAVVSFTRTGTGGIPRSPGDILSSKSVWHDNYALVQDENLEQPNLSTKQAIEIVEAQALVVDSNGNLTLTAEGSFAMPSATSSVSMC